MEFTEPGPLGFEYSKDPINDRLEITAITEGGQAWQKGGAIREGHVIISVQGTPIKNSKHGIKELTKNADKRPLALGLEMSAAGLSRIRKMEEGGSLGAHGGAVNMATGEARAGAVEEAVPPPLSPPPGTAASSAVPSARAAPVGSQLHVRGVGNGFESEEALFRVFALDDGAGGRLRVEQATIRHRIDRTSGENTSWALVTMESQKAAEIVMASRAQLPSQLTVQRFSEKKKAARTTSKWYFKYFCN